MLQVWAPTGVGEIRAGDDLGDVFLLTLGSTGRLLHDGDIVLITSKVVSKAEGQARTGTRDDVLSGETVRTVATRGQTRIVRNHLGLTMAAAGIDASNVEAGQVLLLPRDPDGTAARVRRTLHERTGANVAVIITDTAGRAWREGQTDIAIGAAGLRVLEDFAGRNDGYGNPLVVTAPAVADELAGAAELAQGKLRGRPFAVISGREDLVLDVDQDGQGAAALIRADGADLFGWGAREAVVRALQGRSEDRAPFGVPTEPEELVAALATALAIRATIDGARIELAEPLDPGAAIGVRALAFAFGWELDASSTLRPATP